MQPQIPKANRMLPSSICLGHIHNEDDALCSTQAVSALGSWTHDNGCYINSSLSRRNGSCSRYTSLYVFLGFNNAIHDIYLALEIACSSWKRTWKNINIVRE